MESDNELDFLAKTLGADFFGVADLSDAHDAILDQGGAGIAKYPRAISMGISLFDDVVDRLPQRLEGAVAKR